MRQARGFWSPILAVALLGGVSCTAGSPPETADDPDVTVSSAPLEPEAEGTASESEPVSQPGPPAVDAQAVDPEEPPTPGNPVDPEQKLEASMEAYESAEVFWGQGDLESAIAALDRAYQLMAEADELDDPLLSQERENLRQLISRRVVEIYASRQTAVGDPNGSIRIVINDDVRREIRSFVNGEREFFLESYRRSGLYRPMILEKLREAGLPEQLSWMPLVESGFKSRARSRARALGLWQFISSTGLRYGLERNRWIDERMDPEKATDAAIGYLTDLHGLFGDWLTALAAYNCGEQAVLRQIRRQPVAYFDRFWDLYQRLPRETRRYVPRFLATLAILEDPEEYGIELPEPLSPPEVEILQTERAVDLERLEKSFGLEEGRLAALNPELRHGVLPEAPYRLRVPATIELGEAREKLAEVPERKEPVGTGVHRVRPGETLSGIAAGYGTTVRRIMAMNRLRSAHRIWPGQQLRVPGGVTFRGGSGGVVRHRVRRGDSLWLLASRYGTTVAEIRRLNGIRGSLLRPGQVLMIRSGSSGGGVYVVRSGDTLGEIARGQGVSLSSLLRANHLSRRSTIYPGQRLVIPN
ncbi:MAG: LysM peptidoglycan-binding domain-containing protein [Thermoanaerobaculia bacterium]|nr:LysM peptidoglycan-binding domain-containing protein [Thermoanaerobaculia bacterium]